MSLALAPATPAPRLISGSARPAKSAPFGRPRPGLCGGRGLASRGPAAARWLRFAVARRRGPALRAVEHTPPFYVPPAPPVPSVRWFVPAPAFPLRWRRALQCPTSAGPRLCGGRGLASRGPAAARRPGLRSPAPLRRHSSVGGGADHSPGRGTAGRRGRRAASSSAHRALAAPPGRCTGPRRGRGRPRALGGLWPPLGPSGGIKTGGGCTMPAPLARRYPRASRARPWAPRGGPPLVRLPGGGLTVEIPVRG